jgi:hypothetical protein
VDRLPIDPRPIFAALNRHSVQYIVVGGLAAVLHGSPIGTQDLDICPNPAADNLERLAKALQEVKARVYAPDAPRGVPFAIDPKAIQRATIWNLVTAHGGLDLVFSPAGTRGYADLMRDARPIDVGDGLMVETASLADIIRSKEAAGRDKDRLGLVALRRLLEIVSERGAAP